jgi:hypothetical protein
MSTEIMNYTEHFSYLVIQPKGSPLGQTYSVAV